MLVTQSITLTYSVFIKDGLGEEEIRRVNEETRKALKRGEISTIARLACSLRARATPEAHCQTSCFISISADSVRDAEFEEVTDVAIR